MWSEAAAVHASDETAGALFGSSVFLEGGLMAVGAMHSDTGTASESGKMMVALLEIAVLNGVLYRECVFVFSSGDPNRRAHWCPVRA